MVEAYIDFRSWMRDNKQDEKNQIRGDQPLDYPNWQKEHRSDWRHTGTTKRKLKSGERCKRILRSNVRSIFITMRDCFATVPSFYSDIF